jgi:DNA modification methylase/ParB-like chromosome segregation protein Spo0J
MPNYADIDSIEVPSNRQRKVFDEAKLRELGDSIENPAIGLLHPIVIRKDGVRKVLVAGERRLRAIKDAHELGVQPYHLGAVIPPGKIPFSDIGEMDPLDAWEAELEENINRDDLTWQERAKATAELLELRKQQALKKGLPAPTVASIAEEVRGSAVGSNHVKTRQELVLSRHLDDPDVAAAASPDKAIKILRKKEEKARNERLAVEVGKIATRDLHHAYHADAEVWAKAAPPASFDVIITDPPYGMNADEFGDSGGMADGAHDYVDSAENLARILKWLPGESFRLAKPQAHLYLFCDFGWFADIKRAMEGAGWKVFRTPMIWHKPTGFRAPWPDMGPQRRYECCLYAVKGDKRTVKMGGDVITCPPDDNLGHNAQKPVALYVDLLSRSVIPGDQVLDLFGGTGPLIPAAHALKCRATVIEKEASSFAICSTRLKELS